MSPPAPDRPALFLDFDGTLVEIVDRPDAVAVSERVRALIGALSRTVDGAVAVVTGRQVADIDHHLGLAIAAAGMHGMELRPTPDAAVDLRDAPEGIAVLRERLAASGLLTERVTLEDKGAGLAVHYRAAPEQEPHVKAEMARLVEGLADLTVIHGKMVVEAKGVAFDKGAAVDAFMARAPFAGRTPIFIGDDTTDEDGMRAAARLGGFGIKVGDGPTVAAHRVPDVAAVHAYLQTLARVAEPR